MRTFRADEPTTWTTLDNKTVDDDLSCRALGLLTRWLRRPPGVEVDSIPEMVKRARRNGEKRLEGRDALYAASYELEDAGYIVRELKTNETGQHEWVSMIYSRPVPKSKRSNPRDRKRTNATTGRRTPTAAAKKTAPAKPKAAPASTKAAPRTTAPVPENPELALTCNDAASSQVSPVTGFPDSGNPTSGFQEVSVKDSSKDSPLPLTPSGTAAPEGAEATTEERETSAMPKNDNPVDLVLSAWAAGAGLKQPPASMRVRLTAQVPELVEEYPTRFELETIARYAGERTWQDLGAAALDKPCRKLLGRFTGPQVQSQAPVPGQRGADVPPYCGDLDCDEATRMRSTQDEEGWAVVEMCECHPVRARQMASA